MHVLILLLLVHNSFSIAYFTVYGFENIYIFMVFYGLNHEDKSDQLSPYITEEIIAGESVPTCRRFPFVIGARRLPGRSHSRESSTPPSRFAPVPFPFPVQLLWVHDSEPSEWL